MDEHSIFKSDDMAIIPVIAQECGALHTKLLTYNKEPRIVESSPQKNFRQLLSLLWFNLSITSN